MTAMTVDAAALGAMLARAFFDDPMMAFVTPSAVHRRVSLPSVMAASVRLGLLAGEVRTAADDQAAAIWFPPESEGPAPEDLDAAGFEGVAKALGKRGMRRLEEVMRTFGEVRERSAVRPHWYLAVLGVEPPRQGQGIGAALVAAGLQRADAGGFPCYLETTRPANVAFYMHHGFRVVESRETPGGLHYWAMLREPAAL